jgi:hypothetical protein
VQERLGAGRLAHPSGSLAHPSAIGQRRGATLPVMAAGIKATASGCESPGPNVHTIMQASILHPDSPPPPRRPHRMLRDPAVWAWLIVALLAIFPARAALNVIL